MPDTILNYEWHTAGLAFVAFLVPLLIGFAFSLAFRLIGRGERVRRNRVYRLIASSISITAFLVAVVSGLGTLGIDTKALVAGLGLTGLALGLALKDAVSNFIAGLMIILYSPFDLEDELEVSSARGIVRDMDLRYVYIETPSEQVLIPNSTFLNSIVRRKKPRPPEGE